MPSRGILEVELGMTNNSRTMSSDGFPKGEPIGNLRNAPAMRWFEVRKEGSPVEQFNTFSEALEHVKGLDLSWSDYINIVACDRVRFDNYLTVAVDLKDRKP
jgi:hypothetical protein